MSDVPIAAIAQIPGLVVRLAFTGMKFKHKAKKAARDMRKGMIKGGMSRELATQLASRYEESYSIRKLIGQATGEDFGLSSIFPFGR